MKVTDLKELCREYNLLLSGRKNELINRIADYLDDERNKNNKSCNESDSSEESDEESVIIYKNSDCSSAENSVIEHTEESVKKIKIENVEIEEDTDDVKETELKPVEIEKPIELKKSIEINDKNDVKKIKQVEQEQVEKVKQTELRESVILTNENNSNKQIENKEYYDVIPIPKSAKQSNICEKEIKEQDQIESSVDELSMSVISNLSSESIIVNSKDIETNTNENEKEKEVINTIIKIPNVEKMVDPEEVYLLYIRIKE